MTAAALLVAIGVVSAPLSGAATRQRDSSIREVLDAYAAGRFDTLGPLLSRVRTADSFRAQVRRVTAGWVMQAEDAERERRLRLASLVVIDMFERTAVTATLQPSDVLPLADWVSARFASRPPDAFERTWYLAVVAVAGMSWNEHQLTGRSGLRYTPSDHGPLLDHARRRFPDEPRFELAEFSIRRAARIMANRPGLDPRYLTGFGVYARPNDIDRHMVETLQGLDRLCGRAVVGHEACLRAGVIRFHLDQLDGSLASLEQAATSDEAFVRYLAALMQGQVHRIRQDATAAVAAFERAHAAMPNITSGNVAYATALFLADRREEAYGIIESALAEQRRVLDPWRQYGWADYRFLPALRARLREGARP